MKINLNSQILTPTQTEDNSNQSSYHDESEISNLSELLEETKQAKLQRRELLIQLIEREILQDEVEDLSPVQDLDQPQIIQKNQKTGKNLLGQTSVSIRKDLNKIQQKLKLQPQNRSEEYLLDLRRELYKGDNREIVLETLGIDLDEDLTLDNGALQKLNNLMKSKFILLRMAPSKRDRINNLRQMTQNFMVRLRISFLIFYLF